MDDWPEHKAELARKTSETLDRFSKLYNANKITKREYFMVITALFDTTAGLITEELKDLLADIHKELISKK